MRSTALISSVLAAAFVAAAPASALQPTTGRVSVPATGAQSNGYSAMPSISDDGRYVAFSSSATNLAGGTDTNDTYDVFVRDRLTGTTARIDNTPEGNAPAKGAAAAVLSADGSVIAFLSSSGLTQGAPGGSQVYVAGRDGSGLRRIELPDGVSAPGDLGLSDDGARLVLAATRNQRDDVYVVELASGEVRRMSQTENGTAAGTYNFSPSISGDGTWVAFSTDATNLVTPDANGFRDIVARKIDQPGFTRISLTADGREPNANSTSPALSHDGCDVAFLSSAANLVPNAAAGIQRAFIRHRCDGDTELVSQDNAGKAAVAAGEPAISDSGCSVVFAGKDIFVPAAPFYGVALRDRCDRQTSRIDVSTAGDLGNDGPGSGLAISGTGRYIAYTSYASNLVPGSGPAKVMDVYIRDRGFNRDPHAALDLTVTGARVTADATGSSDADGPTLDTRTSFGDGSAEVAGPKAAHTYGRSGTFTVTTTVTDADGATSRVSKAVTVTVPVTATATTLQAAPTLRSPAAQQLFLLTNAKLTKRSISAARRTKTVLKFRISDAATVTVRFVKLPHNRFRLPSAITKRFAAGTRSLAFTARVGTKRLAPGAYRLEVSARTTDGRSAKAPNLPLTITK